MDGGGGLSVEWIVPLSSTGVGIAGVFWWAIWLSGKFNEMRKEFASSINDLGDRILDKLEYHERHDDARFNNVTNELIAIKIRNAAIDGRNGAKEKGSNSSQ